MTSQTDLQTSPDRCTYVTHTAHAVSHGCQSASRHSPIFHFLASSGSALISHACRTANVGLSSTHMAARLAAASVAAPMTSTALPGAVVGVVGVGCGAGEPTAAVT